MRCLRHNSSHLEISDFFSFQFNFNSKNHPSSNQTAKEYRTEAENNMSYSNTSTGNKSADPYKDANKDSPSLREKIEDLVSFIKNSKFGMMTTRTKESGLLSSRCMAVAAQVNTFPFSFLPSFLLPPPRHKKKSSQILLRFIRHYKKRELTKRGDPERS